jgi:catechol 2,3-dioxygenase-like lactoylglutathione lyase family enzyme
LAHRITKLLKVNLRARDGAAVLQFLQQALGAEPLKDRGDDTIGQFTGATAQLADLVFDVVSPSSEDGALAKSIDQRGEGYDSIALQVENLDDTVAHLEGMGVRVINRTDYHGSKIAFIHPRSAFGMLIELIERPSAGA